jgi:uncharacterized protein YbbK (DUF523 family)
MGRPRVGISRCLLGDAVRYDGGHKLQPALIETLGPHVEWVPVCPEVEMGMTTPREPIALVARRDGVASAGERVRMLGVSSREDWTDSMHAWAPSRVRTLQALDLSGYILKSGSPSCGLTGVRVVHEEPPRETRTGRGLFAQALVDAMPDLPVADEQELIDPAARERFLAHVRAYGAQGERLKPDTTPS